MKLRLKLGYFTAALSLTLLRVASAQTTLSGNHIVTGTLTVGSSGTNRALNVFGDFNLDGGDGGIRIEAHDGGIKLLTPGRQTLLFIGLSGEFQSQYYESYAPFFSKANGRIGSNYLSNTTDDSIDLAARQLIAVDGATVQLDWSISGTVAVTGSLNVSGSISMPRQGDILMGEFGETP